MRDCSNLFGRWGCPTWTLIAWLIVVPWFARAQTNCLPPPNGLVGWWSAEGDADDQTEVNHGALLGDITFEAGAAGQAFAFHGGIDGVRIVGSPSLDVGGGSGLTIETWIDPQDLQIRSPLVEWNREGSTSSEWGTHFWLLKAGDFESFPSLYANLLDSSGTAHNLSSSSNVLTANAWQHVAVTYDRSTGIGRLYRNGEIMAQSNLGIFRPETSYNLFL